MVYMTPLRKLYPMMPIYFLQVKKKFTDNISETKLAKNDKLL